MRHTLLLAGLACALILAVVLFFQTPGNSRNTKTVDTALLGHWQAENGDQLYYDRTMCLALTPEGTVSYHPYRPLMSNEAQSWLKILMGNNEGREVERVISFSEDRTSYQTNSVLLLSGVRHERFATVTYVDEKRTP